MIVIITAVINSPECLLIIIHLHLTPKCLMSDHVVTKLAAPKKIHATIFSENIKPFHFLVQNETFPLTNNYTRLKSPLVCDNARTHSGTGVYICSHTAEAD